MGHPRTLALALDLARRPATRAVATALFGLGLLGGVVPLLDVPGFELGLAGAWVGLLLAGPLGLAAARLERARPGGSPLVAAAAAALVGSAALALLLAGSALRAAFGPCRVLAGAAFFPVLALPSLWLAVALAVAAAWATRGRAVATGGLLALAVAASLGHTLWTAWHGPAAFALDHLLGVWPGPLYDEALRLDARLLLFRLETAALAVLVSGLGALVVRPPGGPGPWPARLVALAALLVGVAAHAGLRLQALDGDRDAIVRALGGRLEGATCTLIFPREKPPAAARAMLADCDFHAADLAGALGLPAPPGVTVFLHRSDEEKRRHVGAGATSFTKPWLREIHLTDAPLPHPVLRHELVHAVASVLAPGPLHVPARAGVLVSAGLVEGLAVALELPRGGWTNHQWTRAARDLGLMPEVAAIVGPAGFWQAAPARAYTTAGSFLAFLLERRGPARVAAAYSSGDLEAAFGQPLSALAKEWSAFLDGVEVPRGLALAARPRFARPAIFAVPCAREVAELEASAWAAAGAGRTAEACAGLRRVASLTGRTNALKGAADLLARAGDLPAAADAYHEVERAAAEDDAGLRAAVVVAQADLGWRQDEPAAAIAGYLMALALQPDRPEARLLQAKLTALRDADLAGPARTWLLGLAGTPEALAALRRSGHPLAAYLTARVDLAQGELAAARPRLEAAAAAGLLQPLGDEASFLAAEAACQTGAVEEGEARLAALAVRVEAPADLERVAADRRRCAHERGRVVTRPATP